MNAMHQQKQETDILIIGGGASAVLLLIHLLKDPSFKGSITVVNNRYPFGKGIAYSTKEKEHLLNVRAARMSVFPDKPADFMEWIGANPDYAAFHGPGLSEKFLPRHAYGEYLLQRLNETIAGSGTKNQPEILEEEAVRLEPDEYGYTVTLASGKEIAARQVILATGNTPPESLPGQHLPQDERIRVNPWDDQQTEGLDPREDVLVLGSSLTMADTILSLGLKNFRGRIHVLSRHGKFPVTHPAERPQGHAEIKFEPSPDLNILYRQIKERIREVIHDLHWQEPVLEAIRPHTQLLWQHFSVEQKKRFLRHLNHRWSILRHRIPAEVAQQLSALQQKGQLQVYAGTILHIDLKQPLLQVSFEDKPQRRMQLLKVQRIFNCTGPEGNPEKMNRPLIRCMLEKGLIRPDALKLGYDALPDGRLLSASGTAAENLFTIGPGLRGILWESTAIPEIRVQAAELSKRLIRNLNA